MVVITTWATPTDRGWITCSLAAAWGLGRETARFCFLVGLLHDADPRDDGAPPRVFVTLDWMDANREMLCRRLGWDELEFAMAQAMIARTEFPFDQQPRHCGSTRDGGTTLRLYERSPANLVP
ncbi:MAG: hypothetical protein HY319_11355, partial [Armatimonadetes bacterium]|nr:hypothetical protein [Armatimonadota bacterium]